MRTGVDEGVSSIAEACRCSLESLLYPRFSSFFLTMLLSGVRDSIAIWLSWHCRSKALAGGEVVLQLASLLLLVVVSVVVVTGGCPFNPLLRYPSSLFFSSLLTLRMLMLLLWLSFSWNVDDDDNALFKSVMSVEVVGPQRSPCPNEIIINGRDHCYCCRLLISLR